MTELTAVCVYCGSAMGSDPIFAETARRLGRIFGREGIRLVYGGGSIGLMGTLARSVLEAGGKVTGVIPQFLVEREVMLPEVTDLVVTQDMHERKRIMFERSDAFVALPGGVGTLEEVVEQMTWAQLGRHDKPIVLADVDGFWAPLAGLLQHMAEMGFIRPGMEVKYAVAEDVEHVVPTLRDAMGLRSTRRDVVVPIARM